MKKPLHLLPIVLLLLFFSAVAFGQDGATETDDDFDKPQPIPLGKDLTVTPFSGDTWLWTALKDPQGKPPMINGLLTVTDNMVIAVNVPWRAKQVDALAKFCLEKLQRRLGKVILTGFYRGRADALRKYQDHGVVFDGTLTNRTLATQYQLPVPDQIFTKKRELEVDGRLFQLYSPGPVIDKDHVFVYIPHDKVLFLGPLVKAPRAKLPPLSQAKLDAWEKALRNSQMRFPEAKYIIASRGPIRDQQAIAQTYILIRQAGKKAK